jgi:SOS-response transcriptional repressor LexA
MKKIDILNFITNFRKAPNDVKTYNELLAHLGAENASVIDQMLTELQQTRVIRETTLNGEKAYQVISR